MTVIGINGSPRKKWNTATLVTKALEGAESGGARTELIHLYDLSYKGCTSCFACKIVGGRSYGRCAMKDDLTPVLEKIDQADGLVLGSPIYFGAMSGEARSFVERLLFPSLVYTKVPSSLRSRRIRTGLIYTMNVPEEAASARGYDALFRGTEGSFRLFVGEAETLCAYDTYQFPDYSKVVMEFLDPAEKAARREQVFPEDCRKAYELGARIGSKG
ncbi:MAG: flavodoxin family protein [Deltaproteobacteria bacterium]|nr:flavodoxin family protein [Deltaproteobacteria bacterium]